MMKIKWSDKCKLADAFYFFSSVFFSSSSSNNRLTANKKKNLKICSTNNIQWQHKKNKKKKGGKESQKYTHARIQLDSSQPIRILWIEIQASSNFFLHESFFSAIEKNKFVIWIHVTCRETKSFAKHKHKYTERHTLKLKFQKAKEMRST